MKNSFADLVPLGWVSVIIGIEAITYVVSRPFGSILLALIGITFGILSLRFTRQEKLERWLSGLGIALSIVSITWSLFGVYGQ